MAKVSIIGMGRVGSTLAYQLIKNPKIEELFIYDVIENKTKGAMLDISHAYPEFSHKLKTGDPSNTAGSKIITITAGVPRTPEIKQSRQELLDTNKKIITDIMKSIKIEKDTILLITTNPVEHITFVAYKLSGIDPKRVIGFSNYLDSQRLKYIISKKTGKSAEKIECMVIGEHGENMIPLFSQCRINGQPAKNFEIDEEEIIEELLESGKSIIDLVGGTQFGPASGIEHVVESILEDSNEIFPLSLFVTNNFYGLDGVCMSIPVKIGKNGVSEVVEMGLNDEERIKLKNLAYKLKNIQNSLI